VTIPTGTFKTYEGVGIREDLSDVVTNISPVETQFYRAVGEAEGGATQTKHEWTTDALAAADENAQLEGDDTEFEALDPTVRIYNTCQIQRKEVIVSGTMNAPRLRSAGRVTKLDYQTAKKAKELANDIEYAFLKEVRVDGDASTARKMRGALNWTTTNLKKASDATLNADGTVTGGTARDLTSAILKGVLHDVWSAGGMVDTIYASIGQKSNIGDFSQASDTNFRINVQGNKLDDTVDIFVSDAGVHAVKPHRQMPVDILFLCDHMYWKKATLRPTFRERLAKTGDNHKWHILVEHTLEARAENASGRITDLNP